MKMNADYRVDYILNKGDQIYTDHEIYTITGEPLGFGGSSILYPAYRRGSNLEVAIKEWFPRFPENFERRNGIIQPRDPNDAVILDEHRKRFEAELMMGEQVRNNTVRAIHLWGILKPTKLIIKGKEEAESDVSKGMFAVMERMDHKGKSFNQLLRHISEKPSDDSPLKTGGLPNIHTTVLIIEQVLLALQRVHEAGENGYIFGDIQDGNIYFADCRLEQGDIGTGMLLDFGCSRPLIDGKKTDVIGGSVFSSRGFIPPELLPEQWEQGDGTISIQADIFSVGCLMLHCLFPKEYWEHFGTSPVIGPRTIQRDDAKRLGIGERLRQYINRILAKSMAAEPTMRYADATAMLLDIRHLKECCGPVLSWENGLTSDILACAVEQRWKETEISLNITNNEDNRAYINILSNAKEVIVFADEDGRAFSFQEIVENNSVPMNYCVDMFPLPGRNNLLYYLIRNNISSAEMVPIYLTRPVSSKKITLHELSKLIAKQYLNSATNETIDAVSKVLTSPQAHKLLCIVDNGRDWLHIVTPITDPIPIQKLTCQCKDYSSILHLSNKLIENELYSLAKEWLECARAKGFSDATDRLGELYLYGLGGKPDPAMAWDLFEEAIKKEYGSKASAYMHMGDMLMGSKYDPTHEVRENPWYAWMHYRYARILGCSEIDEKINEARSATDRELTLLLCVERERMGAFFLVPSDYRCYHIKSRYYSEIAAMLDQRDSMEWVGTVHGLSDSEINRILQCNKIGELKERGYSAERISEELQIPVDDVYIEIHGIMETLWTFRVRRT